MRSDVELLAEIPLLADAAILRLVRSASRGLKNDLDMPMADAVITELAYRFEQSLR